MSEYIFYDGSTSNGVSYVNADTYSYLLQQNLNGTIFSSLGTINGTLITVNDSGSYKQKPIYTDQNKMSLSDWINAQHLAPTNNNNPVVTTPTSKKTVTDSAKFNIYLLGGLILLSVAYSKFN